MLNSYRKCQFFMAQAESMATLSAHTPDSWFTSKGNGAGSMAPNAEVNAKARGMS